MAGMLPGVESARRRRFHQNSSNHNHNHNRNHGAAPSPTATGYGGRSSLCLYVSSHDFNLCSATSSTQRKHVMCDESKLGTEAREAKKRLDEKLQAQWRSETARKIQSETMEKVKKSGSKRLKWLKLSWRSSEEAECVVCLEQINGGGAAPESLMQLRCGHRFHTQCLMPWLEANAHCPCCRMQIPPS